MIAGNKFVIKPILNYALLFLNRKLAIYYYCWLLSANTFLKILDYPKITFTFLLQQGEMLILWYYFLEFLKIILRLIEVKNNVGTKDGF